MTLPDTIPDEVREEIEGLRKLLAENMARDCGVYTAARDEYRRAMAEQAAEIARLKAEVERLRAALKQINVGEGWAAQIARAALEGGKA